MRHYDLAKPVQLDRRGNALFCVIENESKPSAYAWLKAKHRSYKR
jgi:hypothetical protein